MHYPAWLVKAAAVTCKVLAVVVWLSTAWLVFSFDFQDLRASSAPQYRDAPVDWGTPAYVHRTYFRIAEVALLSLLALMPNGILTSSRTAFAISLALALVPFRIFFATQFSFRGIGELLLAGFAVAGMLGMLTPLPLSIIFSFVRRRRGETVRYV